MCRSPWIIFLILYLLAFFPRVYRLQDTGVHMDEVIWMSNSKTFVYGLRGLYFNQIKNAWWNDTKETYAIGIPAMITSGAFLVFFAGVSRLSVHLLSDIVAVRLPIVIIGSFLTPYIYYAVKRIWNGRVALLSAFAYALSSLAITADRWLLHDGFLALFSFVALCEFLISWRDGKNKITPGIFLALAFLSKPNGLLVLIPWLYILAADYHNKKTVSLFIKNIFSFLVVVFLMWPQAWYHSIFSIFEYVWRQLTFAQTGLLNYYLGKPTYNPGWTYYFFQFATENPEIIVIGFLLSLIYFFTKRRNWDSKQRVIFFATSLYVVVFTILISLSIAKPGSRYALPLLPWLYICASTGFLKLFENIQNKFLKNSLILTSLFSIIVPLGFFPNYQMYNNQFIGGAVGAAKIDRISLCVGNKKALEFLDKNGYAGTVFILGCADAAPYHSGRTTTRDISKANLFIVEKAFEQIRPDDLELEQIRAKRLLKVIYENGVDTAKVYSN